MESLQRSSASYTLAVTNQEAERSPRLLLPGKAVRLDRGHGSGWRGFGAAPSTMAQLASAPAASPQPGRCPKANAGKAQPVGVSACDGASGQYGWAKWAKWAERAKWARAPSWAARTG